MSGEELLAAWKLARLRNELAACRDALREMLAELLDAYDGYDKAEAKAYWAARFENMGIMDACRERNAKRGRL